MLKRLSIAFLLAALVAVVAPRVSAQLPGWGCAKCQVIAYLDYPSSNEAVEVAQGGWVTMGGWGFLCEGFHPLYEIRAWMPNGLGQRTVYLYRGDRPDVDAAYAPYCPQYNLGTGPGFTGYLDVSDLPPGTYTIPLQPVVSPYFGQSLSVTVHIS